MALTRELSGGSDAAQEQEEAMARAEALFRRFPAGAELGGLFSALQGMGGPSGRRLEGILDGLKETADDTEQMVALSELCNYLLQQSEDTMHSFRTEAFVGPLIMCMRKEYNPEIMHLACRALYALLEAQPKTASAMVSGGALPVFMERLFSVEAIDVAEQAIHCVEKIARSHPCAVLQEGAVPALLQFIDFHNITMQRKIVATVAHVAKRAGSNTAPFTEALPVLSGFLCHEDPRIVEGGCLIFARLVQSMSGDEEKLQAFASETLILSLISLVTKREGPQLTPATPTLVLRTLSAAARGSVALTAAVLECGGIEHLLAVFRQQPEAVLQAVPHRGAVSPAGASPVHVGGGADIESSPAPPPILLGEGHGTAQAAAAADPSSPPQSVSQRERGAPRRTVPADTIAAAVQLLEHILPAITDGVMSQCGGPAAARASDSAAARRASEEDREEEEDEEEDPDGSGAARSACTGGEAAAGMQQRRVELFEARPELMRRVLQSMTDVTEVYATTVHRAIKARCLSVWVRMLHYAPAEQLAEVLRDVPVSAFITQLIHAGEPVAAAAGLHVADVLMRKLPEVFRVYFTREGVLSELRRLADSAAPQQDELACAVRVEADNFRKRHFPSADNGTHPVAVRLRELARRMGEPGADGAALLGELCDLLAAPAGVSVYELATTGIVDGLLAWLRAAGCPSRARLARAHAAYRVLSRSMPDPPPSKAICSPSVRSVDAADGRASYLATLVRKLLAALHQCERLPVFFTDDRRGEGASGRSGGEGAGWCGGLKLLTQPLRLQLVCQSEKVKARTTTVMIEPLATIGAVAEFIQQRLLGEERMEASGAGDSGDARRSSAHSCPLREASGRDGGWYCDTCMTSYRGPGPKRWRCDGCDFDLCEGCMTSTAADEDRPASREGSQESGGGKGKGRSSADKGGKGKDAGKGKGDKGKGDKGSSRRDWLPRGAGLGFFRRRDSKKRDGGSESADVSAGPAPAAGSAPPGGAAAAAGKDGDKPADKESAADNTVELRICGHTLPPSLSIFQAIHRFADWRGKPGAGAGASSSSEMVHTSRAIWDGVYPVHFYVGGDSAKPPAAAAAAAAAGPAGEGAAGEHYTQLRLAPSSYGDGEGTLAVIHALEDKLEVAEEFGDQLGPPQTQSILSLLRALHAVSANAQALVEWARCSGEAPPVADEGAPASGVQPLVRRTSDSDFISAKLTNKVLRQVLDGVLLSTGHLSNSWCQPLLMDCQHLFSFATRLTFFELVSFGPTRAMLRLQEMLQEQGEECKVKLGRVHKQKIRLARDAILESARKIMDGYCSQKAFLEFEYFGEAGTGTGPTHEFYTLVSRALQQKKLGLWLDEQDSDHDITMEGEPSEHVYATRGLFPRPYPPDSPAQKKAVGWFKFVGQFLARALYDRRLVDMGLSRPLLKLLQGAELGIGDLWYIRPALAQTLTQFLALVARRDEVLQRHGCTKEAPTPAAREEVDALRYVPPAKGKNAQAECAVEDLCLDFTLSGFPSVALRGDGSESVTIWNLGDYVQLTVEWMLRSGIADQVRALWQGANLVFPMRQLRLFSPQELDELLCGSGELFSMAALQAATVCDHGYHHGSKAVQTLFEILCSFNEQEVRKFICFVTGAPRLPVGGLKALRPRLTVVRKTADGGSAQESLPSVMTCQNYLKLPDYDGREQMEAKLRQAMNEGAESFHLS